MTANLAYFAESAALGPDFPQFAGPAAGTPGMNRQTIKPATASFNSVSKALYQRCWFASYGNKLSVQ